MSGHGLTASELTIYGFEPQERILELHFFSGVYLNKEP